MCLLCCILKNLIIIISYLVMEFLHHCLILLPTLIYNAWVSSCIKRDGCPRWMASSYFREIFPLIHLLPETLKWHSESYSCLTGLQHPSLQFILCLESSRFGYSSPRPNLCWNSKTNSLSLKFSPQKWKILVLSLISIWKQTQKQNKNQDSMMWY